MRGDWIGHAGALKVTAIVALVWPVRGVHVIEPVGAVLECELVPHVQRVALAMGLCGYRLCRTLPSLFAVFHFCVCDFKRGMIEGGVLSGHDLS